jgi:hypothetical protein
MESSVSQPMSDDEPMVACACQDPAAVLEYGDERFEAQFNGSISVRVGSLATTKGGQPLLPLGIVGYSTTSVVPEFDTVTVDFDFSSPVDGSHVVGTTAESFFPATHTMNLRITVRLGKDPDRLLRSDGVGTLVNSPLETFPPPAGSTYVLQSPLSLVDPEVPDAVAMRVLEVGTRIVETSVNPERIDVGRGLSLLRPGDESWAIREPVQRAAVAFELENPAEARLYVLDAGGATLTTVEQACDAGRSELTVEIGDDAPRDYRLELDGEMRTASMPLVRAG